MDFLKQIAAEMTLPVFAIGGINTGNLPQVIDSGVRCIAVQSVVTESQDPAATCRQRKEKLEASCN
jgi:thiamine-phosphate pyrophosphorylase